jgi:hypothetical protein
MTVRGGPIVSLAVAVLLLVSRDIAAEPTPLLHIKGYNYKARDVVVSLPDGALLDDAEASQKGDILERRLIGSYAPLIYALFGSDPTGTTRLFMGMGTAAGIVHAGGKPVYAANVAHIGVGGTLELGHLRARYVELDAAGSSVAGEEKKAYHFAKSLYPALGICAPLASSTVQRCFPLDAPPPDTLRLAVAECYSRSIRYMCGKRLLNDAGDIAGATTVDTEGRAITNLRLLESNTRAAAVYVAGELAALETDGTLPRVDVTWYIPPNWSFSQALGTALQASARFFVDTLAAVPLDLAVNSMAVGVTSLFATHWANLHGAAARGLRDMDSLAVQLALRSSAALMRSLGTGRAAGHGSPPPVLASNLGTSVLNTLTPPVAAASRFLGISNAGAEDFVDPVAHFADVEETELGRSWAANAARNLVALRGQVEPYLCNFVSADGSRCDS